MSVLLNGMSQTDLGVSLIAGTPSVRGFSRKRAWIARPGYTGAIPSLISTTEPDVEQYGYWGPVDMTVSQRNAMQQRLSALLTGPIEVQKADGTERRRTGICTVYDGSLVSPTFVNVAPKIIIEITYYNAAFEDIEPQQFTIGTTPVRMAIGTAGHALQFILVGANTTPVVITYRDFQGVDRGHLSFTPVLAANETLTIDTGTEEFVRRNTSNVDASVASWITDIAWPEFVPRHAQRELQVWGTLEATTSIGVRYRRNWEN